MTLAVTHDETMVSVSRGETTSLVAIWEVMFFPCASRRALAVDVEVFGFWNDQRADDGGGRADDDREPEPGIDVAGCCHEGEGEGRGQPAAPAGADVRRRRHRGVANTSRKHLDQHRRNRAA